MMRHTLLLVVACALLVSPAAASPITYTFTGEGDLAGTFAFDDAVEMQITTTNNGRLMLPVSEGRLVSPSFTMDGAFGAYTFSGVPYLHVVQWDDGDYQDHWIVRAPLTASSGGPLSLTWLNLFMYTHVPAVSLTPPTVPTNLFSPNSFQYTLSFADGNYIGGSLSTLQQLASEPRTLHSVPEPYSATLPWLAFAALALTRRLTRVKATKQL